MRHLIHRVILTILLASRGTSGLASEPNLVETLARQVHERHFDRPPLEEIPTADLQGLSDYLQLLDPWSRILSPQQSASMRTHDRYREGIGVKYFKRAAGIVLVPLPDGPLFRKGVTEPAHLIAIDDIPATGVRCEEALTRIKANTERIKLTLREISGNGRQQTLQVPKAEFRMVSAAVTHHGPWPIVRVYRFVVGHTHSLVRRQLNALATSSPDKRSPLIIDLRYATGGHLVVRQPS